MAQGLGAIAEQVKKRREAQEAAEGKSPEQPKAVTPATKAAVGALNKPPSKPYVRPAGYDDELRKELELRKKKTEAK